MKLMYAASNSDIFSINVKIATPIAMVRVVNAGMPPGTVLLQEEVSSITGPQNIPRPQNAMITTKTLPTIERLWDGQMSPNPTL
jgi:hypothetical protein